jgi:cytidylate kinase
MTDPNDTIIAIDGPAGAGKSTVARRLAERLSYLYLDTGAMYRAITWEALNEKVDLEDGNALTELARRTVLELVPDADVTRVLVNGRDITDEIRLPEVTNAVTYVDRVPGVRQHMLESQRAFGRHGRIVAEGRDIGTVVFPDAACKIYLDASLEERAVRRWRDMRQRGMHADIEEVKRDIKERDANTMQRNIAPLRQAEDAVRIDTTSLSVDEIVETIRAIAESRQRDRLARTEGKS